jgi:hypothetical protein
MSVFTSVANKVMATYQENSFQWTYKQSGITFLQYNQQQSLVPFARRQKAVGYGWKGVVCWCQLQSALCLDHRRHVRKSDAPKRFFHLRKENPCRSGYEPVHTGAISVRQWVDVEPSGKSFLWCHTIWLLSPTSMNNFLRVHRRFMERRTQTMLTWCWGMYGRLMQCKPAVSFRPALNALTHPATVLYSKAFSPQASGNPS